MNSSLMSFRRLANAETQLIGDYFKSFQVAGDERSISYFAVVCIQRYFARYRVRRAMKAKNNAATVIQSAIKRYLAVKEYKELKKKKEIEEAMIYFNSCAISIQRVYRGFISRKYIWDYYARQRYLKEIAVKNEKMQELAGENERIVEEEEKNYRQILMEEKLDRLANKFHYLLSTQTQMGVLAAKKRDFSVPNNSNKSNKNNNNDNISFHRPSTNPNSSSSSSIKFIENPLLTEERLRKESTKYTQRILTSPLKRVNDQEVREELLLPPLNDINRKAAVSFTLDEQYDSYYELMNKEFKREKMMEKSMRIGPPMSFKSSKESEKQLTASIQTTGPYFGNRFSFRDTYNLNQDVGKKIDKTCIYNSTTRKSDGIFDDIKKQQQLRSMGLDFLPKKEIVK